MQLINPKLSSGNKFVDRTTDSQTDRRTWQMIIPSGTLIKVINDTLEIVTFITSSSFYGLSSQTTLDRPPVALIEFNRILLKYFLFRGVCESSEFSVYI